ncbi:MBL fold metallo-hydrolase [Bosea caraganae]|uniref:MBL fold metallo-hydrolase n=1 Tax=Bosea caraganae TaxID=2763117 RepID=A0A370LAY9_9HYPH|nr:MBL fold metallo-hydrolase [Bosea caraganae]RDJ27021.1 MBL fold metallo-hydrolase [Bosea caraganae]RDJ29038.1 MBL fold metallo-hydrolase [Bosea caraganae]
MTHVTHVFTAPEAAFLVNSFILEGDESIVVIDAQFLVSSARALRRQIDAIGKPIAALILSHPHPDHYNGAAVLLDGLGKVPVLATSATAEGIRATAEAKRLYWTPHYGTDYPRRFVYPDRIIASGETLRFGGIELVVDDLGPSEASDNVALFTPRTGELFASDLVYSACHPWLAEGRAALWLAQLDGVAKRYADVARVHAGHGPSGAIELLDAQQRYIVDFEDLVRSRIGPAGSVGAATAEIHAIMVEHYPGYPLEFLIDFNAAAIASAMSAAA